MELEKNAQERLYQQHKDLLYRWLWQRLGNREEAEDICHDAFVKAFSHLQEFRQEASFKNWLFQIAKNLLADHWRKHYRLKTVSFEEYFDIQQEEVMSDENKAGKAQAILEKLSPQYREILEYRFLRNYSLKETAEALGISENNVKVRQYRAIKEAQKYV